MGRFVHEAVAVDPRTNIIYQTEDQLDGLVYRFLPNRSGRLEEGGRLQCLSIDTQPRMDTRNWDDQRVKWGDILQVRWVDLEDVEWVDKYSFHAVYPSNYAHTYEQYNRDNPAWFNYCRLVFRPKRRTSRLVISDWANAGDPGGPVGQTTGFNFVEIQPFLKP